LQLQWTVFARSTPSCRSDERSDRREIKGDESRAAGEKLPAVLSSESVTPAIEFTEM
jgi:hypothetical protein